MQRNEVSADLILEAMIKGILRSGTQTVIDGSFSEELSPFVDQEKSEILSPEAILSSLYHPDRKSLLDFGCGTGGQRGGIEGMGYRWTGVNYREGMASSVREQASNDSRIDFYDGLHLPYPDESFDVVYSFQVFEHIQDIGVTFSEIARVLKPSGALVGAVSYLEQMHDYSTYNFTPYGLKFAAERSGLRLHRLYPSYDVFTWMARRLLIVTSGSDENSLSPTLRRENEIHKEFVSFGERMGLRPSDVNLLRLMFSSHFSFHIVKPHG
jgi:SAM-dependent methyltransferase